MTIDIDDRCISLTERDVYSADGQETWENTGNTYSLVRLDRHSPRIIIRRKSDDDRWSVHMQDRRSGDWDRLYIWDYGTDLAVRTDSVEKWAGPLIVHAASIRSRLLTITPPHRLSLLKPQEKLGVLQR